MKALFLILLTALWGHASPFEVLANRLSSDPIWMSGEVPIVNLPPTAKHKDIIRASLEAYGFSWPEGDADRNILVEKISVKGIGSGPYFAGLIHRDSINKVIVFTYLSLDGQGTWWTRIYDAK